MNSTVEIFSLNLDNKTRCIARVDVGRIAGLPADKLESVVAMDWEGPRESVSFDRWRLWQGDVWQYVADKANKAICSLLITPAGELMTMLCEPGKRPQFQRIPTPR